MTDPKKTAQQQEEEQEDEALQKDKDKANDPHRGTADTPSQHKALDPHAERNNDEEDYDEDGVQKEKPDDQ